MNKNSQRIIKNIKHWVETQKDQILFANIGNFNLTVDDHIKLFEMFEDKPTNCKIIYEHLQNAIERYKQEDLSSVPPIFFRLPGETPNEYLDRVYDMPF